MRQNGEINSRPTVAKFTIICFCAARSIGQPSKHDGTGGSSVRMMRKEGSSHLVQSALQDALHVERVDDDEASADPFARHADGKAGLVVNGKAHVPMPSIAAFEKMLAKRNHFGREWVPPEDDAARFKCENQLLGTYEDGHAKASLDPFGIRSVHHGGRPTTPFGMSRGSALPSSRRTQKGDDSPDDLVVAVSMSIPNISYTVLESKPALLGTFVQTIQYAFAREASQKNATDDFPMDGVTVTMSESSPASSLSVRVVLDPPPGVQPRNIWAHLSCTEHLPDTLTDALNVWGIAAQEDVLFTVASKNIERIELLPRRQREASETSSATTGITNIGAKSLKPQSPLGPGAQNQIYCGAHWAANCSECPVGRGANWCNGDCLWDESMSQCVFSPKMIWCGGHAAASCQGCVWSGAIYRGEAWCNGECYWLQGMCHAKYPNAPPMPAARASSSREVPTMTTTLAPFPIVSPAARQNQNKEQTKRKSQTNQATNAKATVFDPQSAKDLAGKVPNAGPHADMEGKVSVVSPESGLPIVQPNKQPDERLPFAVTRSKSKEGSPALKTGRYRNEEEPMAETSTKPDDGWPTAKSETHPHERLPTVSSETHPQERMPTVTSGTRPPDRLPAVKSETHPGEKGPTVESETHPQERFPTANSETPQQGSVSSVKSEAHPEEGLPSGKSEAHPEDGPDIVESETHADEGLPAVDSEAHPDERRHIVKSKTMPDKEMPSANPKMTKKASSAASRFPSPRGKGDSWSDAPRVEFTASDSKKLTKQPTYADVAHTTSLEEAARITFGILSIYLISFFAGLACWYCCPQTTKKDKGNAADASEIPVDAQASPQQALNVVGDITEEQDSPGGASSASGVLAQPTASAALPQSAGNDPAPSFSEARAAGDDATAASGSSQVQSWTAKAKTKAGDRQALRDKKAELERKKKEAADRIAHGSSSGEEAPELDDLDEIPDLG